MNRIGSFQAYQNAYPDRSAETLGRKAGAAEKKTEAAEKKQSVTGIPEKQNIVLSDRAKALLEELQKTYTNMDFYVGNFETDQEADRYLSGLKGTKEYNVLIDVDTLESMAADSEVRAQYESLMKDSVTQLKDMIEQLGSDGEQVTRTGISINKDGTVSYFAELDKLRAGQKERLEQARQEKAQQEKTEEKASGEKTESPGRFYRVEAGSTEELLERIRNAAARDRWQNNREQDPQVGSQFDYTV